MYIYKIYFIEFNGTVLPNFVLLRFILLSRRLPFTDDVELVEPQVGNVEQTLPVRQESYLRLLHEEKITGYMLCNKIIKFL